MAGEGGVFKFDRKTGKFKKYELGGSVNEIVLNLFTDTDGVLWIGTINHGVRRYNDESDSFQSILDETGYLNKYNFVPFVAQDKNGAIWFGIGKWLVKYNLQNNHGTFFGDDWIPENSRYMLRGIFILSNGEILLGIQNGYFKFHPDDFIQI